MPGAGLEVQVTHCIEEIGQENWDALSGGRAFASYAWYRFGERAMTGSTPLYMTVYQSGRAVASASFWLVNNEPLPVGARPLREALHAFLRARPLLICRSPLADTGGLVLPEPPLRRPALQAILSAAREYGRRSRASFLVFDYLDAQQAGWADWPGSLSAVQLADPGTCLPVAWASYEEYLNALPKSVWKDYRRQRNQAERLGLEITAGAAVEEIEAALPLIRSVEQRHGSPPKPWAKAMLENAALVPSTWVTARVNRRLVGCGLLLMDRGVCLATLLGLDPTSHYVYFQVVYRAIRQAIEQGARLLRGGSGAYELKQRLGFQLEANNHLRFAGQGPLLNWMGRAAAGS